MNTRSLETCASCDASIDDARMHVQLVATNDEHLSLVKTLAPVDRVPSTSPTLNGRLFHNILVGMAISVLVLVMVIATKYPDKSFMQSPTPFIYHQLIG